jgi:hypothetical protein
VGVAVAHSIAASAPTLEVERLAAYRGSTRPHLPRAVRAAVPSEVS